MQASLLSSPAARFALEDDYEYALVVNPAAEVCTMVAEEMQRFNMMYRQKTAAHTIPHITIARFFARQPMEETIIRYMLRITATHKTFGVMLNNYSCSPFNNIFIRVQQHEPFQQLFNALQPVDEYIQRCGYPAVTRIARPHINVAKKLQAQVYNKAVFDYAQRSFNAAFAVKELVLVKRRSHFDEFKQVNIFKLAANE
jgi:2'-5' RNA ligase